MRRCSEVLVMISLDTLKAMNDYYEFEWLNEAHHPETGRSDQCALPSRRRLSPSGVAGTVSLSWLPAQEVPAGIDRSRPVPFDRCACCRRRGRKRTRASRGNTRRRGLALVAMKNGPTSDGSHSDAAASKRAGAVERQGEFAIYQLGRPGGILRRKASSIRRINFLICSACSSGRWRCASPRGTGVP